MAKKLPDLAVEMANVVARRNITLTNVDVDSTLKGVRTGLNLAILWLEAGESLESLSPTINLLIALADVSEPDLGKVISNANMHVKNPSKKFSREMFEGVTYRRDDRYSWRYRKGIVKGFLHGMDTYNAYENMSSESKIEFATRHLKRVHDEIKSELRSTDP